MQETDHASKSEMKVRDRNDNIDKTGRVYTPPRLKTSPLDYERRASCPEVGNELRP